MPQPGVSQDGKAQRVGEGDGLPLQLLGSRLEMEQLDTGEAIMEVRLVLQSAEKRVSGGSPSTLSILWEPQFAERYVLIPEQVDPSAMDSYVDEEGWGVFVAAPPGDGEAATYRLWFKGMPVAGIASWPRVRVQTGDGVIVSDAVVMPASISTAEAAPPSPFEDGRLAFLDALPAVPRRGDSSFVITAVALVGALSLAIVCGSASALRLANS